MDKTETIVFLLKFWIEADSSDKFEYMLKKFVLSAIQIGLQTKSFKFETVIGQKA